MSNDANTLDLTPLDKKTEDIAKQILEEDNIDQVKDLTALFNLNAQKRNVLRVIKMNSLLDKVTNQITDRFEHQPDNFTNEELLKYMQVTEAAIDRANKNLNLIEETPMIQLTQNNQVNVNVAYGIDQEGRERVLDTVNAILKCARNQPIEPQILTDEGEIRQ